MTLTRFLRSSWLALLTAFLLLGGCDNSIEPFSEKGTYSIYGFLDPDASKQLIRVKPLSVPITKVDSGSINATVTIENLDDGTADVLEDSLIAFEDAETEVLTHNFWTETPIPYETKYRITIEGEAGSVQATTTTPTGTDPEITPQFGECNETFTVVFKEIEDSRRVWATFEVRLPEMPPQFRRGEWAFFPMNNTFKTEAGYAAGTFQVEDTLQMLLTEVGFLPSPPAIPDSMSKECWRSNPCAVLDSDQVRVRYTYLGPEWYGDVPEDDLTYDPMESHDVAGGLGFFGSARRDRDSTTINTYPYIWTGGRMCTRTPPDSISDDLRTGSALF